MKFKKLIFLGCTGLVLLSAPTVADDEKNDEAYSPLSNLYKCAAITGATQRLACFDNSVASLRSAEEKKEIVAIDAKAARKIKREAFGFNLPSLPKLGLPKIGVDSKVDALTVPVKSIRKSGRIMIITLENGQVWKEVGGRLNYVPKGDLTATIKPKSVGSYMLSLNNGKSTVRGLRVRRVE